MTMILLYTPPPTLFDWSGEFKKQKQQQQKKTCSCKYIYIYVYIYVSVTQQANIFTEPRDKI